MVKLLLMVLGLVSGAAGTAAWLLSETSAGPARTPVTSRESFEARIETVKAQFQSALAEGERSKEYTEDHMRRRLDAYRTKGGRPTAS